MTLSNTTTEENEKIDKIHRVECRTEVSDIAKPMLSTEEGDDFSDHNGMPLVKTTMANTFMQ